MSEEQEIETADINDNIGTITYIMLGRIYDLLVLICDAQGKSEDALKLIELHRQGHLMSPLPAISEWFPTTRFFKNKNKQFMVMLRTFSLSVSTQRLF